MDEKKFTKVAAFETNSNWNKIIKREKEIYYRADDIRTPFARDYTRILHSLAYRRLKHKTQVFFNAAGNDHICTRIEHVMHVESVSNTIANYLGLNEELTRAIAMSHDLGHAPFGHQGEKILNEITKANLNKKFWHEKNGVYFVDKVELLEDNEKKLRNLNLTYAVRDGIISHCGEIDQNNLKPREDFFVLDKFDEPGKYQAVTWEGCIVKLADKIAYLGRDIEDAIRLGYIQKEQEELLQEMARINNEKAINTTVIMHNMIIDLCKNSSIESGLCLSEEMNKQLKEIKDFNYKYIYGNEKQKVFIEYSKLVINQIFEALASYYKGSDTIKELDKCKFAGKAFIKDFAEWIVQFCDIDFSTIEWADEISEKCRIDNITIEENLNITNKRSNIQKYTNEKIYGDLSERNSYIQAVIDFIAGMTDIYAIQAFNELLGG